MKALAKAFLTSKKAATMLVALVVLVAGKFGLDLDAAELALAVSPMLGYIASLAFEDKGKAAKKLELDTMDANGEPVPDFAKADGE